MATGDNVPQSLPEVFFEKASVLLAAHPALGHEWISDASGKRTLKIPAADADGFDVEVQAETYGLYPFAGGWHGAPWDANSPDMTLDQICEDCLGFVRSLLCGDSSLTVFYSNGHPIKCGYARTSSSGERSARATVVNGSFGCSHRSRVPGAGIRATMPHNEQNNFAPVQNARFDER